MKTIDFEWDDEKNRINKRKHNISFEEASTVFYDEEALVRDDPDHSEAVQQQVVKGDAMREEYDFSNAIKNPYAKKLKKQITINIEEDTIKYFKSQSDESGIPYQTLINLYLTDCAKNQKKLQLSWA